jgi:ribonucleoside-diphosphate reductase alpha chain
MKISHIYTTAGDSPYSGISFVPREYPLDPSGGNAPGTGSIIAPEGWSTSAVKILATKYVRRRGVPSATSRVDDGLGIDERFWRSVPVAGCEFGSETDARQVFHRLAGCWAFWGLRQGYFDTTDDAVVFYDEICAMLARQIAAPNSPQWFNTGLHWAYGIAGQASGYFYTDHKTGEVFSSPNLYEHPAPFACFINSIKDDLVNPGGIVDFVQREARIFKLGSGSGADFSLIRGKNEPLSGGGYSSGVMSFLKIGDTAAGAIKSGGTTRRAAKMVMLSADHPDVETFIGWKASEEKKVAALVAGSMALKTHLNAVLAAANAGTLPEDVRYDVHANPALKAAVLAALAAAIPQGSIQQTIDLARQGIQAIDIDTYDLGWESEAYLTVAGQNSNNSIRFADSFRVALEADGEWHLIRRTDGGIAKTIRANDLFDQVARSAWESADPGVLFDTTINDWHTVPADGRINGCNPCVTGDTLVATTEGLRRIADLVGKAAFVYGSDGRPHFVSRIFKTGTKPVFNLRTKAGYRLRVTADHQILTANRGDVAAKDLQPGDRAQLVGAGFGPNSVDPAIATALGLAVGDGCLTDTRTTLPNGQIVIVMSREEPEVLEPVASGITRVKQRLSTRGGRGRSASRVNVAINGISRLSIGSAPIVQEIRSYTVLDQGSPQKRFTDKIFELDEQSVRNVLRGLFAADGTVSDNGEKSQYVGLESTSLTLLEQTQLLLLSFGVKAKLYRNRKADEFSYLPDGKGGSRNYPRVPLHSLRITRSSRTKFAERIGFADGSPKSAALTAMNSRVQTYAEKMTDEIIGIEPCGIEDVYDLTEPDTHHFVGNGIVIHNCAEYHSIDDSACNLASARLTAFLGADGSFDHATFSEAVRLWTLVLEISVAAGQLPSATIAANTWRIRNLGLGYTDLGAMLMRMGIPYDSADAFGWAAAITALETGVAYRTSAEMAREQGPFASFERNRDAMLRVISNHARAAGVTSYETPAGMVGLGDFDALSTRPVVYAPTLETSATWAAARAAWTAALQDGAVNGFRNSQVTVIAPAGTIGIVMDGDTTGVEPDYALVKSKQLAGGGFLQIVNRSVEPTLRRLGYRDQHIPAMLKYVSGSRTLVGAPHINTDVLHAKGLSAASLSAIETQLTGAFSLENAFNIMTIAKSDCEALGLSDEIFASGKVLAHLGFTATQVAEATDVILGRGTLEGAPHFREEHLPIFDTATPTGRSERYIRSLAHIDMLAAVQPFVSGSVSKTINMPATSTIADIREAYLYAWDRAVKAVALYRDGSKLSQPLAGGISDLGGFDTSAPAFAAPVQIAEKIVYRYLARQRKLPNKRGGYTQKFKIGGQKFYLRTGDYADGTLGEIFLTANREGATMRALLNNIAVAVSLGLQHGVPLEEFVDAFTFTRFEPAGPVVDHDHIKMCTSFMDAFFRDLAFNYLGRVDLAQIRPEDVVRPLADADDGVFGEEAEGDGRFGLASRTETAVPSPIVRPTSNGHSNGVAHSAHAAQSAGIAIASPAATSSSETAKAAGYTGETCTNCSSIRVVRTGACTSCLDCMTSSGCG